MSNLVHKEFYGVMESKGRKGQCHFLSTSFFPILIFPVDCTFCASHIFSKLGSILDLKLHCFFQSWTSNFFELIFYLINLILKISLFISLTKSLILVVGIFVGYKMPYDNGYFLRHYVLSRNA